MIRFFESPTAYSSSALFLSWGVFPRLFLWLDVQVFTLFFLIPWLCSAWRRTADSFRDFSRSVCLKLLALFTWVSLKPRSQPRSWLLMVHFIPVEFLKFFFFLNIQRRLNFAYRARFSVDSWTLVWQQTLLFVVGAKVYRLGFKAIFFLFKQNLDFLLLDQTLSFGLNRFFLKFFPSLLLQFIWCRILWIR